jgi:hypothetical protein
MLQIWFTPVTPPSPPPLFCPALFFFRTSVRRVVRICRLFAMWSALPRTLVVHVVLYLVQASSWFFRLWLQWDVLAGPTEYYIGGSRLIIWGGRYGISTHPHRHHQDIFGAGQRRAFSKQTTPLSASNHVRSGVHGPFHRCRRICGTSPSLPSPVSELHHAFYAVSVASALQAIYRLGPWDLSLLLPSLAAISSGKTSECSTHRLASGRF